MSGFLGSIVIPAISEKDNLSILVPLLQEKFPKSKILIVSSGTEKSVLLRLFPKATVLSCNKGFSPSVVLGLSKAKFPAAVIDADLSHSSRDLLRMERIFLSDKKPGLLIGSRYCKGGSVFGWSFQRRFFSRSANSLARFLLGSGVSDLTSGMRIYSKEAAGLVIGSGKRFSRHAYSFQLETAIGLERSGCRVIEAPIAFSERRFGKSKTFSIGAIASFFISVVRLFSGSFRLLGKNS